MKQGINIEYLFNQRHRSDLRPLSEALTLCSNSGFTELDHLTQVKDESYEENAHLERTKFDRYGVCVHQSHCPFFRYQQNSVELFRKFAPRAVEAASILGAKHLVIHADEYRPSGTYDSNKALQKNYELMAPVVELCLKHDVSPAFENLFEENKNVRSRFTAEPEELITLIERFHDPRVGVCLDYGHAQVSHGKDVQKVFDLLGPYIHCTHVHDNYYGSDLHLPAFFGTLNWENIINHLKKINYPGNFTWELVYGHFPNKVLPYYLELLHQIGNYLLERFNDKDESIK